MQEGQPVAYAPRALTITEQNYAQIEEEHLAIVFGLKRFHHFTYARPVVVQTDHKQLVILHKKSLLTAPKRLQRMFLRLQQYDLTIEFHRGHEMFLADTLSRAFLPETDYSKFNKELEQINAVDYLSISETRRKTIQAATELDETLRTVRVLITQGWPDSKGNTPQLASPYYHIRDELTIHDGIIFKGQRCVIPAELRSDILQRHHSLHMGTEGCLRRAREYVYWPNMNKHVEDYISKCDVCRTYEKSQCKETLMSHEVSQKPWQKIGVDLFTIHGKDYLITVDYFSNFGGSELFGEHVFTNSHS